ncbi:LacI family DNA-binding transcriptional regulator [Nonomuraea sp. NPDC050556]|uniref:LacI family DNA-binding transcriptional regulator n=1 Tax=Nonomuraea sp. NPDC050556 TaxID=3364369 RepID=UPI0037B0AFE2
MKVRLIDVARAAGVSKTTVSDALNGAGRLPEATREHVKQVARSMGYRPNATARLLRAGHTRLIGLAAREYVERPWVYTELAYFAQLATLCSREALARGYGIVLLPNTGPDDCWLELPLDGVFIVDPVADDPLVGDFLSAGIPILSDRRAMAGTDGPWIDFDYGRAVHEVMDHLHAGGARRIAAIAGATTAAFHHDSARAYLDWCASHGCEPRLAMLDEPGLEATLVAVESLLGAAEPPDALFSLVEVSPPLLLDTIRRLGRSVPGDLLLVCATEEQTAPYTDPPVTTLSFVPEETARAGIELLVDRIEGRSGVAGRLLEPRLEIRASSRSRK